jgi:hypothetical protein
MLFDRSTTATTSIEAARGNTVSPAAPAASAAAIAMRHAVRRKTTSHSTATSAAARSERIRRGRLIGYRRSAAVGDPQIRFAVHLRVDRELSLRACAACRVYARHRCIDHGQRPASDLRGTQFSIWTCHGDGARGIVERPPQRLSRRQLSGIVLTLVEPPNGVRNEDRERCADSHVGSGLKPQLHDASSVVLRRDHRRRVASSHDDVAALVDSRGRRSERVGEKHAGRDRMFGLRDGEDGALRRRGLVGHQQDVAGRRQRITLADDDIGGRGRRRENDVRVGGERLLDVEVLAAGKRHANPLAGRYNFNAFVVRGQRVVWP